MPAPNEAVSAHAPSARALSFDDDATGNALLNLRVVNGRIVDEKRLPQRFKLAQRFCVRVFSVRGVAVRRMVKRECAQRTQREAHERLAVLLLVVRIHVARLLERGNVDREARHRVNQPKTGARADAKHRLNQIDDKDDDNDDDAKMRNRV